MVIPGICVFMIPVDFTHASVDITYTINVAKVIAIQLQTDVIKPQERFLSVSLVVVVLLHGLFTLHSESVLNSDVFPIYVTQI